MHNVEPEEPHKEIEIKQPLQNNEGKPVLSLERQLELAKYFYINEMRKTEWRNIIL